jgi:hypothetical protein
MMPFGRRAATPAQPTRMAPMAQPATVMPTTTVVYDGSVELAAMQTPTVKVDVAASPTAAAPTAKPAMNLINSKSLLLDFEVKSVGPSGVGSVELWYTRNGQIWHKHNGPTPTQSPIAVDVSEDGLYGFTVVASSGSGIGRTSPQPGEPPQIWVEVDTTRPDLHLVNTQAGVDENGRALTLRWTCTDKNLVSRPITLYYAEQASGPWMPFATNLDNVGQYTWQVPQGLPAQLLVKVEATDRVGNNAEDQMAMPAPADLMRPKAAITKASRNGVIQQTQSVAPQGR